MTTIEKREAAAKLDAAASKLMLEIAAETAQCQKAGHVWRDVISDPRVVQRATYSHMVPHGSDPEFIYNYHDETVPRWSRTCSRCGVKEYTEAQKPTAFGPDFQGAR